MGMLIMIVVSIVGAIVIAYITQHIGDLLQKRRGRLANMHFVHNPEISSLGAALLSIGFILLAASVVAHNPTGFARDFLIFIGTGIISLFVVDRLIAC